MVVALPHKRLDAGIAPTVPFLISSEVIALSTRYDDYDQFTIFVEDAQEYSAFLHSSAGVLASRKRESASLDHSKKCRKKAENLFRTRRGRRVPADHLGFNAR